MKTIVWDSFTEIASWLIEQELRDKENKMPLLKTKKKGPRAKTVLHSFTHIKCEIGSPFIYVYSPSRNGYKRFNRSELAVCMVDFKTEQMYKCATNCPHCNPKTK